MNVSLSDSQFAWFSRWNKLHAIGVASPFQGEGEGEGLVQGPKPLTLILSPCLRGEARKDAS
jgi:hypothetical protein